MDFSLTDEQQRLRRRDPRLLPARVRHPGAARAAHRRLHRAALGRDLLEDGRARLARGHDRRAVRRLGRRHGRRLPVHGGDLARAGADRRLRDHADRRRRGRSASAPTSRSRRSSAASPRGSVEAIAMTEPEAGSDVGSLTTSAERVNGGYVLNGQKVFCSNAHISDHVLVVARTTKGESQARGPVDDLRPHRQPGDGDPADRHARAAARPTTSTSPTARRPRTPSSARSTRPGCS